MPSQNRRASGIRRAWGRGPIILKLESLERRDLLSATGALPDLVNSSLATATSVADWNDIVTIAGRVTNQGSAPTTAPFEIDIYASPVRGIDRYSVPIGAVTIAPGLAAGQSALYNTSVTLPATPIPYVASSGGTVYITAWVNPKKAVAESNYRNNKDIGPPHDAAPVLIAAPAPADLVGTTLAVTPTNATWGTAITVTAQISNQGAGPAPPTRALLTLTPQGQTYGGTTSVGIGSIMVPALGPYQTVNVVQSVTLPAIEPLAVTNYTNFGLAMTQDAGYVTNELYPHQPTQGQGLDQTPITITYGSGAAPATPPLPDLAASSVLGPAGAVRWGESFPVSTVVQNLGQATAGAFLVRYLLTGASGSINNAIFLGDETIAGLAPGASRQLSETLKLPSRLPSGVTLNSVGWGRVAVLVDPENAVNESLKSNNNSISAPFVVRLPGNADTVPTTQAAGALPSVSSLAQKAQNQAKLAAAVRRAAKVEALLRARPNRKLHRRAAPKTDSVVNKAVSLGKEIYKLPTQVFDALKKSV
jgi:hypothetical protein